MKPVSPTKFTDKPQIPDAIIEIVNKLIELNWDGREAIIYESDIISQYLNRDDAIVKTSEKMFEKRFLDFEYLYKDIGWNVIYDSPDIDENFKSYFKFTK